MSSKPNPENSAENAPTARFASKAERAEKRAERLKAALKANMARRKGQARARSAQHAPAPDTPNSEAE